VTLQVSENASPAMNEIFPWTITKGMCVTANAPASMCVSSESISKGMDKSDLQFEKQSEQMI
jgi:hypothetical protein